MAKKKPSQKADWGQFFRFLKQIKLDWILILITLAVNIVYFEFASKIPGATAQLMAGDFTTAAIISCVGIYLLQLALNVVVSLLITFATARSTCNARKAVWDKMMQVKTEFYRDNSPEQLLSAVTADTAAAVTSIVMLAAQTIPMVYYMFRSFSIVGGYNWKLLMTLLVMVPVNILYAIFVGKWQFNTNARIQGRIGGLTGYLAERLKNLNLIKSFANEKTEEQNGQKTIKELYGAKKHSVYINSLSVGYMMGTEVISMVAAVLIAASLLKTGELTLEGWMAFYMFMPKIGAMLRQLCNTWITVKGVQGYTQRLGKIMDAPCEELSAGDAAVPGAIAFENITFSYGEDKALENISFTAPAGKVTALVGLSGSGKSTVLNLIERLYTPQSGSITLNGKDVAALDLQDYRRIMAYVPQDAGVFSGSFREVLTYGVEKAVTEEDLIRVSKLAGIYDFIAAQPKGFDSVIAPWGATLSGGQRQRLVIAREALKDAPVLLFDEPTSSLDAVTARAIQNTILTTFKGKTILMVSHDLSLVGAADHIAVIHDGQILACGKHQELLASCPLYKELVDEQAYQEVYA